MTDDLTLIIEAARAGGAIALKRQAEGLTTSYKDGNSPLTNADLEVDAYLRTTLLAARPDFGWLSEETADDPIRLTRKRLFVVDPIDGTRAYIRGRPWWVIVIGIVEDGLPVTSAIYAPALEELYTAEIGQGARLNGELIRASDRTALEDCGMVGDAALFQHPAWPRPWPRMRVESRNATAYRMCLVASGAFDAAVAMAPKSDWDVAAGDLIAREAGATVCDHKGERFGFNRPLAAQASLVCATPALAPLILQLTQPIDLKAATP